MQSIEGVNLHVCVIQAERALIHAGGYLSAGVVKDAVQTTLHDRPVALHASVGVPLRT